LIAGFGEIAIWAYIGSTFSDPTHGNTAVVCCMILIFTFFYTAITINSNDIADNLKENGGFVPGVNRKANAEFIDTFYQELLYQAHCSWRHCMLPAFAVKAGVGQNFAQFFGGTSL
jgi:preprotein translocase subunit SecY